MNRLIIRAALTSAFIWVTLIGARQYGKSLTELSTGEAATVSLLSEDMSAFYEAFWKLSPKLAEEYGGFSDTLLPFQTTIDYRTGSGDLVTIANIGNLSKAYYADLPSQSSIDLIPSLSRNQFLDLQKLLTASPEMLIINTRVLDPELEQYCDVIVGFDEPTGFRYDSIRVLDTNEKFIDGTENAQQMLLESGLIGSCRQLIPGFMETSNDSDNEGSSETGGLN